MKQKWNKNIVKFIKQKSKKYYKENNEWFVKKQGDKGREEGRDIRKKIKKKRFEEKVFSDNKI